MTALVTANMNNGGNIVKRRSERHSRTLTLFGSDAYPTISAIFGTKEVVQR